MSALYKCTDKRQISIRNRYVTLFINNVNIFYKIEGINYRERIYETVKK